MSPEAVIEMEWSFVAETSPLSLADLNVTASPARDSGPPNRELQRCPDTIKDTKNLVVSRIGKNLSA